MNGDGVLRTFIKDLSLSLVGGSWWGPGRCLLMSLEQTRHTRTNTTKASGTSREERIKGGRKGVYLLEDAEDGDVDVLKGEAVPGVGALVSDVVEDPIGYLPNLLLLPLFPCTQVHLKHASSPTTRRREICGITVELFLYNRKDLTHNYRSMNELRRSKVAATGDSESGRRCV